MIALLFSGSTASAQTPYKVDLDELPLTYLDGKPFKIDQLKGQALFVTFWATWCKPCLDELAGLHDALPLLPDSFLTVVAISDESIEKIQKFSASQPYRFLYIKAHKQLPRLGIYSIPTSYLIDDRGRERYALTGSVDWSRGKYLERLQRLR